MSKETKKEIELKELKEYRDELILSIVENKTCIICAKPIVENGAHPQCKEYYVDKEIKDVNDDIDRLKEILRGIGLCYMCLKPLSRKNPRCNHGNG